MHSFSGVGVGGSTCNLHLKGVIPGRIGIWTCWFLRRGENRSTRRKTSLGKGEIQQQTQTTYGVDAGTGFEPGPHWWEASALTTSPPLLPSRHCTFFTTKVSALISIEGG